MTSREELVNDWQNKWDEIARTACHANSIERWKRRSQRRMYECLTSMYGHGEWRAAVRLPSASADHEPSVEPPSLASLPKSVAQIRKALKKIHGQLNLTVRPGPYMLGLLPSDWICVAATRRQQIHRHLCRLMGEYEIAYRVRYNSNGKTVFVRVRDYQLARQLIKRLKNYVAEHPEEFRKRTSWWRRFCGEVQHGVCFTLQAFRQDSTQDVDR